MDTVNILLVSDNHGSRECLTKLREMYGDYDLFVHCGDSEMEAHQMTGYICVKGNNDFSYYSDVPYQMILSIRGHRILVTHGHQILRSYFRYEPLAERAEAENADVVFFGHTHMACDEVTNGVRLLNPGSLSRNRDGSPPSYMLVHISEESITAEIKEYVRPSGSGGGFLAGLFRRAAGERKKN